MCPHWMCVIGQPCNSTGIRPEYSNPMWELVTHSKSDCCASLVIVRVTECRLCWSVWASWRNLTRDVPQLREGREGEGREWEGRNGVADRGKTRSGISLIFKTSFYSFGQKLLTIMASAGKLVRQNKRGIKSTALNKFSRNTLPCHGIYIINVTTLYNLKYS